MDDWQTEPLGACLDVLLDYRGKSPPRSPTGIPVLSAKVVKTEGLLRPIEQKIAPDYYPIWMVRGLPKAGDVVMTTEAPLGEVIQLDEETANYALGQRIVCLRGKKGKIDNTFLRYLLASPAQQAVLAGHATGTTVLGISQKALRTIPINFPPLKVQQRIGSLLAALDDKIELNRRMNETLDTMAAAIFRDWFVDFGPSRAKMEGRPPYLKPFLWSIFPARLDANGLPEGWTVAQLDELIEINPPEPLAQGVTAPYLNMAAVPTCGPNPVMPIDRAFGSGTKFRNGDTLLARITPCLENGKTALVQNLPDDAIGWGSTEFIVMRSRSPVPRSFSYLVARDPSFRSHVIRSMTGTSGRQRVPNQAVTSYSLIDPRDDRVWEGFASIVEPFFQKSAANEQESASLIATRDLLLPNLLSGKVQVEEVQLSSWGRQ